MKKKILLFPLSIFLFILIVFFYLLNSNRNPSDLPSVLINKKVPVFEAESLLDKKKFISTEEFGNKTTLVNFFASWCAPCLEEHVYIKRLSRDKKLRIIGINYKDNSNNAIKWLDKLGNPYSIVLTDSNAEIGIDWGVYGIPETFIINQKGIIKYRHNGPINEKNFDSIYLKIKNSIE